MSEAPKRRGRPPGSKNKSKGVPMQQGAVASIDDIFADDEPVLADPDPAEAAVPEPETAAPRASVAGPLADLRSSDVVRVRCVTRRGPWTDKKSLAFGEEAEVPKGIAALLVERKFVEYI